MWYKAQGGAIAEIWFGKPTLVVEFITSEEPISRKYEHKPSRFSRMYNTKAKEIKVLRFE